ncbi:Mg transporter [Mycena kentingensis (nom. inval.)]|nr:Mg transporter [Mycena kentingensis (nom. inval.)]
MPDSVSFRGVRVWLATRDKLTKEPIGKLQLDDPTIDEAQNEITIPVQVMVKNSFYSIEFCTESPRPHMNATCDFLRSGGERGELSKIGYYWMSAEDASTQMRSSHGRLNRPLAKTSLLCTSHSKGFGSIALEIRRCSVPPIETITDPDTEAEMNHLDATLFDSDDANLDGLPFARFLFQFNGYTERVATPTRPTVTTSTGPWPTPSPGIDSPTKMTLSPLKRPREDEDEDKLEDIEELLASNARAQARLTLLDEENARERTELRQLAKQLQTANEAALAEKERLNAELRAKNQKIRAALALAEKPGTV